ncbi:hypothetical protein LGN86_24895, partial [Escherichia coli]|nr:hypothetical protein [Escherichia coli]
RSHGRSDPGKRERFRSGRYLCIRVRRNAEGNQRLHFLINIYGAKEDGGEVVLRPFIVNPDELMLTPADVVEFNSQVIKVDRQRHPEWFR